MKIGPREYTKQEMLIIEAFKSHIQSLQKDIDDHWDMLSKNLKIKDKISPERDYLWDYVINDFYS